MQIHHISLVIDDIQRSKRFYCGLLGLQEADRPDLGFEGYWLQIGSQQIHFLKVPNPDPTSGRPEHVGRDRHVAFKVNDLSQIEKMLMDNDIYFTRSRSGRKALFFRDPDENGIEVFVEE